MAPLAGGPSVADEFKASSVSSTRLADRLRAIREGNSASTGVHSDLPEWLKNAHPQDSPFAQQSNTAATDAFAKIGAMGQTATGATQDAFAFNQAAAARKLAAQQRADALNEANNPALNQDNADLGAMAGAGLTGSRASVIAAGKKLLGTDYVYGGGHSGNAGPSYSGQAHGSATYGIDCSGLVRYAFQRAGLEKWGGQANAATESMYGKQAPIRSLMPGDLVVKGGRGSAHHVAIYLGKGMILEAQQTGTKVHIRSIGGGAGWQGIHLNY